MRKPAILSGVLLCVVVFTALSNQAQAQTVPQALLASSTTFKNESLTIKLLDQNTVKPVEPAIEPPKPKEHVVATGESLTTIAKTHETTWQRLYAKNVELAQPDIIKAGDKIVVPLPEEVLAERALPEAPVQVDRAYTPPIATKKAPTTAATSRGSSAGNRYTAGYCTYHAKNMRPDLPNNLGNADTWVARAAAQGLPTGTTPQVGAIGQQGMHVVYVERVNGDGTVTISEMNYEGFGVVSSRTVSASSFRYIY